MKPARDVATLVASAIERGPLTPRAYIEAAIASARREAFEAGYNAGWNDGVDKEAHDHGASGLRAPPPDYDAALAAALAAAGLARCSVCGDRPCIHDGPKP